MSLITLLATFACMGVGAWISRAGGEVSHSEFRVEGVSPETPASGHSHSMPHGADHDNASTNSESAPHAHPAEPAEQVHPSHADEPHTNPTPIPSPEAHHHADSATNSAPHATTKAPPAAHEHANTPAAVVTNTASPHQHPAATATNSNPSVALHQHNHPSDAASAAPHSTNAPVASSERTPDTPEAIWTELRQRHELFARAIKGKDTAQIHANAVAIQKLANALVSVVHPDYKVAVQKGADQIIAGARGAHRSAHADDQAAVESNFKLFEQSLEQLEQKMKKQ
jgi:hypothetical protein